VMLITVRVINSSIRELSTIIVFGVAPL